MSHVPGYSSARPFPDHRQLVQSPYGTPSNPLTPKVRRRGSGLVAMIVLPSLGIGAVAIVGEHLTAPDPQVTIQSGIGFAVRDGSEIALVPYDRTGSDGLIAEVTSDMFQVRLAAVDLASGELQWDVQLTDELGWNAAVVAAGETYAYLATDDGLTVLEVADGETAAEPGEITGLEGAQAVAGTAYAFDAGLGAVVALDVNGGLHTIALDTLEAVPADEATAATWSGRLFAEGTVPDIGGLTTTEALLADGKSTVRIEPTADGALGGTLAVDDPDGGSRALGTRVYYEAAIVVDQPSLISTASMQVEVDELTEDLMDDMAAAGGDPWAGLDELAGIAGLTGLGGTAAGAGSGHVLVEHRTEPGAEAYAMHVIALDSGRVTASFETADRLGRALTSPGGYTAVIAAPEDDTWWSDLVIVAPGGSIDRVEFGATDLLGEPELG
jgi:hypothetical protein